MILKAIRGWFFGSPTTKLVRTVGIYTVASVLQGTFVFFLMPILTRHLTQEEYGLFALFRVLCSFAKPFVAFKASMGREYFERERIDFPAYVTNNLLVIAGNGIALGLFLLALGPSFGSVIHFPAVWFAAVLVMVTGKSLMQTVQVLFRVEQRAVWFGVFSVAYTLGTLLLSVVLVTQFGMDWRGAAIGETIPLAILGLVALVVIWRKGLLRFRWRPDFVRAIYVFQIPLVFHLISRTVITMSDRVFLSRMTGLSDTGLYAVGYQIGMIIYCLTRAFNNAWGPHVFKTMKEKEPRDQTRLLHFIHLYWGGLLCLATLLSVATPWIVGLFLGEEFRGAERYVAWVAFGFAFNGMYAVMTPFIFYVRRTSFIGIITVTGALLNLALNYGFITWFGPVGAAQASTVTFLFLFVFTLIVVKKHCLPKHMANALA